MINQGFAKLLTLLVSTLSVATAIFSIYHLPLARLDVPFFHLALITILVGSRVSIKIPHTEGPLLVSDALILLAMLLLDGEAAVTLAIITALSLSLRRKAQLITSLFHAAVMIISPFLIVWSLRFCFGSIVESHQSNHFLTFVLAACLMALLQCAFNFASAAIDGDKEIDQPILASRAENHFWTFIAYFACALLVGVLAKLIGIVGFNSFIAATTVLAIIHFTYRAHLNNTAAAISQSKQALRHIAALQQREELFRSAFDYAAIGMALVSSQGRWLQVNRSLCEILGYTEQEMLESRFEAMTHPDDLGTALANVKQLLVGKVPTCQMEKRYVHKGGHAVWVLWSVSQARDAQTESVHLIFQIQDITDRKCAEERLLHDALHDALTGLPNRALFMDHLQLAVGRAQRRDNEAFAVLFLDLDRFKIINDSLGHLIGDQLLVGIARRLESCLRPGDTVARLGGDEFTVLLEDIKDETEAISIAERLQKELSQPFNLGGREVFTSVSTGIAPSSTGYENPEEILRDADTAMYRAKSLGRARHEVFDKTMHAFAVNLLQLETDLRGALDRGEFFIQYQPIVALETFMIRGFEALVRWKHPTRGLVSPIDFVPVAEETGLILPIGQWVLKESCRQMRQWQTRFPSDPPLFVSVNLSSKQFTQPDLIQEVARTLQETQLDPRSLKLEITESAVMENVENATEMLRQLRALGVQLSIDDFGTGYSSLSYLHRFPIDTLKIDRSFVTRMVGNTENIEIVRTIVMLAQNLGMDVVAEGVETNEQLVLLRELECENGQGYFFSKPTDVEVAEQVIADTYSQPVRSPHFINQIPFRRLMVA